MMGSADQSQRPNPSALLSLALLTMCRVQRSRQDSTCHAQPGNSLALLLNSAPHCVQGREHLFCMTGFAAGVRAEEMSEMRQGTVILKTLAQLDQMFGETELTKDIYVIPQCLTHLSRCWCHCLWDHAGLEQLPKLLDKLPALQPSALACVLAHAGIFARRLSAT